MKQNELIYWASIFDMKGYVGIVLHKPTQRNRYGQYVLQTSITQKHGLQPPISEFGGRLYYDISSHNNKWMLNSTKKAIGFLKAIQPYSKIKQRQIEIAVQFDKLVEEQKKCKPRKLTELQIEKRNKLMEQLKQLKGKKLKLISTKVSK